VVSTLYVRLPLVGDELLRLAHITVVGDERPAAVALRVTVDEVLIDEEA
jgi:hypothetical protein